MNYELHTIDGNTYTVKDWAGPDFPTYLHNAAHQHGFITATKLCGVNGFAALEGVEFEVSAKHVVAWRKT